MPCKDVEARREYNKQWRIEKIKKDPHYLEEMRIRQRSYYIKNRRKVLDYFHKRDEELKFQIFRLLGGKCSNPNCAVPNGCSDPRCLQIDHINGGGAKEWKIMHNPLKYYKHILREIQSGSKDYQLLCANCNWIKRHENHELL